MSSCPEAAWRIYCSPDQVSLLNIESCLTKLTSDQLKMYHNVQFHNAENCPVLSWVTRVHVAVGAARGLCFLHELQSPVIYRDFKASNVLLDSVSS